LNYTRAFMVGRYSFSTDLDIIAETICFVNTFFKKFKKKFSLYIMDDFVLC